MNSLLRGRGARRAVRRRRHTDTPGPDRSAGLARLARPALACFAAVALLALPLFAHGCHGDDVDHEPFFVPFRLNVEER